MDPKARFTIRADDYARYRPSYPDALIEHLQKTCTLHADSSIADVGSGTGILSGQLLSTGATVYAIEPNGEMRAHAASLQHNNNRFHSIDGSAEEVPLSDACVNLVTAAQAFHWFEVEKCRLEFRRILRPSGWIGLIWNVRNVGHDPFQSGFESLLKRWVPEYTGFDHRATYDASVQRLFEPDPFQSIEFANPQLLLWEELYGRIRSSSYFPPTEHPDHEKAMKELAELFDANKRKEQVDFDYTTHLFLGQIEI